MRFLGGLAALLVAVFITVWLWSAWTSQSVQQAKPALDMANQLAGQDSSGVKAKDSITLQPAESGGRLRALIVTGIVAGGPMETFYGLRADDQIIQAGSFSFRDADAALAQDMVLDAYTKRQPLEVVRNGQRLSLPPPAGSQGAPAPADNTPALQRQLQAIPGTP
jgi:hypothetical protein